jgi:DNA uptake protein ComE-like DNA-binding protein
MKINLNIASEHELTRIEGIGRARASFILAARPFRSWEDVRSVRGIDETLLQKLQSRAELTTGDGLPERTA